MAESVFMLIREKKGQRSFFNGILAVVAGILSFAWPEWLYMMVGIYFLALALMFIYFRGNTFLTATSAIAGLFILFNPQLIPITFALFLVVFGVVSLFSGVFVWVGAIALVIAVILFLHPGSIAYLAGIFLLIFGIKHLLDLFQESRGMELWCNDLSTLKIAPCVSFDFFGCRRFEGCEPGN